MITLDKVKEIETIIKKYMSIMSYLVTGDTKPDMEVLDALNIRNKEPIINLFYKYGKTEMFNAISIKNKNVEEIYKMMQHAGLSNADKQALLFIKINVLNAISNFGEDIASQMIYEVTKDDIENVFIKNINTKNTEDIANKLEDITKDYTKNWKSIAHSELWNAKIYGQVASILEHSKEGLDTKVYKKLEEGACKHCKKHYLNEDGTPKIFTLRELINNGTNYGKKVADWKPTLGIMHPNCMCRLVVASTGKITPSMDLIKSGPLTGRKVDKTKLRYEKKLVSVNGVMHEQGFWVRDDDAPNEKEAKPLDDKARGNKKVKDANAQGYSGDPEVSNGKTVGPGKTKPANVNIAGMNQHNGADINNQEPQTIQVTQGDKDIELPKVPFAALPKKKQKYFGDIVGFDYGTALSLKYIYGRKAALKYLEETGFDVQVEDTEKAWNNAWNEISQYLAISNSPNEKGNYTDKVFDLLHGEVRKSANEGDYARLINTVTGDIYSTLGVYDYDNDKVVGVVTQVGTKFYGVNGANSFDDIFSRWLRGKTSPVMPLVPLELRKDPKNEQKGDWFFNEIKVQSANVKDKAAKEILKKLVKELTGEKPALE